MIEQHADFRKKNPSYQTRVWNEEDILDAILYWYGRDVRGSYLRINPAYPAARADLFRHLLIYQSDGLYFDLKSIPIKPLETIIKREDQYLLAWWPYHMRAIGWGAQHEFVNVFGNTEFVQWFIAAKPQHPYLFTVIDAALRNIREYDRSRRGVGMHGVIRTTGPVPYTLSVARL